MTAIVGTINRRGVAFAADSAATLTISDKVKITNHTNKIFALSKKHPVGIAIYNNLDFHGVPWENIFKMYRDNHLKDNSFAKLSDYTNDFWRYLTGVILPKLYAEQKLHIAFMANQLLNEVKSLAIEGLKDQGAEINNQTILSSIIKILQGFSGNYKKHTRGEGFEGYTKKQFNSYALEVIDSIIDKIVADPSCPKDFKDTFVDALFWIIMSNHNVYFNYTGLIFWGYGEDELFPSYYEYQIGLAFDNRVKHNKISDYEVSNSQSACIAPFAQSDVANTVVRGIDQRLKDTIIDGIFGHFSNFRDNISETLRTASAPQELIDAINGIKIDDMTKPLVDDINNYIRDNYTGKLLETVAFLNKEDLADMAESLVRMTCLKRHVTTDDETVGGPVDVAVITKGDGFIWIKRKHYFEANLNHHYFAK